MFMYLRKNKKGFTLIELMVVVAIIGILALLGLRVYTTQQDKAKEAIVKANASTVHTLIQSALADGPISDVLTEIGCETGQDCANMQNPFGSTIVAESSSDPGVVVVSQSSTDGTHWLINANDAKGSSIYTKPLEAIR